VGRVGNRYVWQGGQTENQGGQTKKNFFGASRRILPTLAWNPAGAPACGVCLSVCLCVCPSVKFENSVKTNKHIFNIFTLSGSQTILVFPYQTALQYSDGNLPNRGVEYKWGRQKSRFWAYIWLQCVMLTLLPARWYQYGGARPWSRKLWHIVGSGGACWWQERTTKCLWQEVSKSIQVHVSQVRQRQQNSI